jgi:hypothetical protein
LSSITGKASYVRLRRLSRNVAVRELLRKSTSDCTPSQSAPLVCGRRVIDPKTSSRPQYLKYLPKFAGAGAFIQVSRRSCRSVPGTADQSHPSCSTNPASTILITSPSGVTMSTSMGSGSTGPRTMMPDFSSFAFISSHDSIASRSEPIRVLGKEGEAPQVIFYPAKPLEDSFRTSRHPSS